MRSQSLTIWPDEKNPPKIRLSPFPLITDTFYPKGSGLKNCAQPPQSIRDLQINYLLVLEVDQGVRTSGEEITVNTNPLDPKLRLNQLRVRGNSSWQL